ncbi:TniQ family protein [Oxalobacteraceae bacterium]|nr:TniQ family protein [Oxalobacteraceae bacterium]
MNNIQEQWLADPVRKAADEGPDQLSLVPGPVLDWLPGESLYSLLARNHYFRGHRDPSHTVCAFFGTLTGKSHQKDMTEIDVFVARTGGALGAARQVLEERTLLRFYRIFMEGYENTLLEPGRLSTDSILKFPTGLQTGRFRTKHPLKGCSACLERDARQIGFQYWRLVHQFPGLWVCLEHDRALQEIQIKPKAQQKFLWQTPAVERLLPVSCAVAGKEGLSKFRSLAQLIVSITSDKEQGIRYLTEARGRFCRYLSDAGFVLPSGPLRSVYKNQVADLCVSFVEFVYEFRRHPEFKALPENAVAAFRLLSRYVNGRSVVRPLERVVITAWLEQLTLPNGLSIYSYKR